MGCFLSPPYRFSLLHAHNGLYLAPSPGEKGVQWWRLVATAAGQIRQRRTSRGGRGCDSADPTLPLVAVDVEGGAATDFMRRCTTAARLAVSRHADKGIGGGAGGSHGGSGPRGAGRGGAHAPPPAAADLGALAVVSNEACGSFSTSIGRPPWRCWRRQRRPWRRRAKGSWPGGGDEAAAAELGGASAGPDPHAGGTEVREGRVGEGGG
ncbi:hypothetical protein BS78_01G329500 [Paspalum vaginatum]|nr:hypothetical protein BS78_01G329500 [Paspalum vaginatum]